MSLDISPDGITISFDMLGDLYLLPIEGGKAKRITKGLAFDSNPKFSPDGKDLLFISEVFGGCVWKSRPRQFISSLAHSIRNS